MLDFCKNDGFIVENVYTISGFNILLWVHGD